MDTVSRLPDPQPSGRTTVVPTGPDPPAPGWVAPILGAAPGILAALAKRKENWVPGAVAGLLAAVLSVYVHDQIGSTALKSILSAQDERLNVQDDRFNAQDDRFDDIEDVQRQLVALHQHQARIDEWRDKSMIALAKKLEVELDDRPRRDDTPVIETRANRR